jgi:polar amino acid transport system substrate-binding protein
MNTMLALLFFVLAPFVSSDPVQVVEKKPLVIDISPASGCVQKDEAGNWYGPDIEFWLAIAHDLQLKPSDYQYREVEFTQIFTDLEEGKADLGFSCITATSDRMDRVSFSTPYLDGAGIGVLVKNVQESKFSRFFTVEILVNIVLFWIAIWFGIVILSGIFTWKFDPEHGDIDEEFAKGIAKGVWGSFATATTIGWGDVTYRLWGARTQQILLWVLSTIVLNLMVSDLTSSLTVNDLSNQTATINDVQGKRIATVTGTTSETLTRSFGGNTTLVSSLEEALKALESGKVDAVVYDAPSLRQFAKRSGGSYAVLRGTLNHEYYAVAMPLTTPLKLSIDRAILKLYEDGRGTTIVNRWFGP